MGPADSLRWRSDRMDRRSVLQMSPVHASGGLDPGRKPTPRRVAALLVPNGATAVRICVGLVALHRMSPDTAISFSVLCCVFLLLDGIDGGLARRLGSSTRFGDIFDHSVDRLFMLGLIAGAVHLTGMPLLVALATSSGVPIALAFYFHELLCKDSDFRRRGASPLLRQSMRMSSGLFALAMAGAMAYFLGIRATLVMLPLAALNALVVASACEGWRRAVATPGQTLDLSIRSLWPEGRGPIEIRSTTEAALAEDT